MLTSAAPEAPLETFAFIRADFGLTRIGLLRYRPGAATPQTRAAACAEGSPRNPHSFRLGFVLTPIAALRYAAPRQHNRSPGQPAARTRRHWKLRAPSAVGLSSPASEGAADHKPTADRAFWAPRSGRVRLGSATMATARSRARGWATGSSRPRASCSARPSRRTGTLSPCAARRGGSRTRDPRSETPGRYAARRPPAAPRPSAGTR